MQQEWYDALQQGCSSERSRRGQLTTQLAYARSPERKAALTKALEASTTPSCEQFETYFGRRRR